MAATNLSSADAFLNNTEPLDPRELRHNEFLATLQGNILKGHGRDNTVHMLVSFKQNKAAEVKKWIGDFAEHKVTSFKEQLRQREIFKRNKIAGGLFAGLYFTARFYTDFGFVDKSLTPDNTDFEDGRPFFDGMSNRMELHDSEADLEDIYKQPGKRKDGKDLRPIHAMILLAHADLIALNTAAREICEAFDDFDPDNRHSGKNPIADTLTAEYGAAIRNANGDGLEHFGYVDGISQPLFLKDDMDEYRKNNVEAWGFDPFAPLKLVLVKDPLAPEKAKAYGSYFVFRKLEQNVRGFKEAEEDLGEKLGLSGEDEERAGAMIIGRFEDGTPVTLSGEDKMISSGIMNNFSYGVDIGGKKDDAGARCPFHGHIRKTNSRPADRDDVHRMARRGITYGHRNVSTTVENHFVQMPTEGVGLLFMSFQSSIEAQFEFIQTEASKGDCIDLIIGQEDGNRTGKYATKWNEAKSIVPAKEAFPNFVHLKGGEYFFAPSLPFLKSLGKDENNAKEKRISENGLPLKDKNVQALL